MELDWQQMLFQFLGGLGIFLFSIKYMGDGLQKAADYRLRDILNRFTSNPMMGIIVGFAVTVLIHSSSATTVLVVGLVSAGFMTLKQAIGVILGANVGTTITSFIIGINLDIYFYPMLAIGAFLIFFFHKGRLQHFGQALFGFGGLFLALEMMSEGMKPLRYYEGFSSIITEMSDNSLLAVVIGTVFTMLVQSSSATVGVLQGMYAEGLVPLKAAIPIMYGENIGTTITAVLASIGAGITAKRAAFSHVLINVIGTCIFLLFLQPFILFIEWLSVVFDLQPKMEIAFAHGLFNVFSLVLFLPFISAIVYMAMKVVPGESQEMDIEPNYLSKVFIETSPSIAIGQAKEEVLRMAQITIKGLEETLTFLKTGDLKHALSIRKIEANINLLHKHITDYVVDISKQSLTESDSIRHHMLLNNVRDIERIGDHFENILELLEYKERHQIILTDSAIKDLVEMFELTFETVLLSVEALNTNSFDKAQQVAENETYIDDMEDHLRQKQVARMNLGECTGASSLVFTDIVSNLERIGDHALNIAESVLGIQK